MKKTIFFVLACIYGILTAHSIEIKNSNVTDTDGNQYMQVLEVGKIWTYKSYCVAEDCTDYIFRVQAKEMIKEDGKDIYLLEFLDDEDLYTTKAYEEDGVLYMYYEEECMYVPMIDFNLEVGDAITEGGVVTNKEYVVIEGIERCLITIDKIRYWCEGIGAIGDNFMTDMLRRIGHRCKMIECWMGDKCLYNATSIEGNNSVKYVLDENDENGMVYDMLGRRISKHMTGHIYIQDGKKHIIK